MEGQVGGGRVDKESEKEHTDQKIQNTIHKNEKGHYPLIVSGFGGFIFLLQTFLDFPSLWRWLVYYMGTGNRFWFRDSSMIKSQDLRESGKKKKGGEVCKIKFGGVRWGGMQQLSLVENILLWHFISSRLRVRKKPQAWAEEFRAGNWQEHGNSWSTPSHLPSHPREPVSSCPSFLSRLSYIVSRTDFWGKKRVVFLPSFYPKLVFLFLLCGLPPSWQHYLAAQELTHRVKLTVNNKYPLTFLPTGEKLRFNRRPLELCVLIKRWTFPPLWCLREPFYFFSRKRMVVPVFSKLTIQIKVYLVSMRGQQCW